MEIRAILIISSVLFSCGCVGLVVVRLTNPFFKGLGWLGGAFAVGAVAAILFAVHPAVSDGLSVLEPNTLILLAFVFLHACVLEMTESASDVPKLGIFLVLGQAAVYPALRYAHNVGRLCVVTLGILLAVQATESAWVIKKRAIDKLGAPAWFSFLLLLGFAGYNLFRSIAVAVLGTPQNPQFSNPLELLSAFVFLGMGLGLGFGMFWMASAQVRLKLELLANIDPLTGIYNRRSFIAQCEQELARSLRSGEAFSILLFDLDHFKQINDRHGHGTGDVVLCAVVEKLRNAVRNIDVVGRWGGEEFVALLPKADSDAALIVAQRLRHSVETLSMPAPRGVRTRSEGRISVTISVGVATYVGQVKTIADLLHQCDTAMYQAKAEGRNRIVSARPQYALAK
jgi:diguanylate cyclase (GGDEF)-like protein